MSSTSEYCEKLFPDSITYAPPVLKAPITKLCTTLSCGDKCAPGTPDLKDCCAFANGDAIDNIATPLGIDNEGLKQLVNDYCIKTINKDGSAVPDSCKAVKIPNDINFIVQLLEKGGNALIDSSDLAKRVTENEKSITDISDDSKSNTAFVLSICSIILVILIAIYVFLKK